MKIATFNINNVNKRLDNLLVWLHQARPDVACFKKASDSQVRKETLAGKASHIFHPLRPNGFPSTSSIRQGLMECN